MLVTGETGSGKTTQVPQYLLEDAYANQVNALMRIPIEIAARNLLRFFTSHNFYTVIFTSNTYNVNRCRTLNEYKRNSWSVMWIRINRMRLRIHKIWSLRIRIQNNKITKSISNYLLRVKKKNIFKPSPKP